MMDREILEMHDTNTRYFRWLFVLILCLTFIPIPVYIYVLEQHSDTLSRIEAQAAAAHARIENLENLLGMIRRGAVR